MANMDKWVVGMMVAVIGLFGLYLSSRAEDAIMYYVGIAFFVGSLLFNFFQIKQAYDDQGH